MEISKTGNRAKKTSHRSTGVVLSDGTFLSNREQEELTHKYRGTNGWKKVPVKILAHNYDIPLDELKGLLNRSIG